MKRRILIGSLSGPNSEIWTPQMKRHEVITLYCFFKTLHCHVIKTVHCEVEIFFLRSCLAEDSSCNHIYNKILDRDWFPGAYLSRNWRMIVHGGVQL